MKIHVKTTGLDLTPSFQAFLDSKLGTLSKYVKRFNDAGSAELWIEVARTTRHHHKGDVYMAEGNLRLPGKVLRAVDRGSDARAAVDAVRNTLRLEIEKYKTKLSPKARA